MDRIEVAGGWVRGRAVGAGVPILLIHGSLISAAWDGLLQEPVLSGVRLITWHRRGYQESSAAPAGFALSDQAADAAAVLSFYGVDAAHVVGHSFGGRIALRLLDDHPARVSTLGLLESGGPPVSADDFVAVVQEAADRHASGDDVSAVDGFLGFVAGADYRHRIAGSLPDGWFDQVVRDARTFFEIELPARSSLTADTARKIDRPVLNVIGERSPTFFQQAGRWVDEHLPRVTTFRLPGATHLLQMDNPAGLAAELARFVDANTRDS